MSSNNASSGSFEDEIGRGGGRDLAGDVLDMLRATGASDEAILEALDGVAADIFARMDDGQLPGFLETSFDPTPGADNTIRLTVHEARLWDDIAAAAEKLLLSHAKPTIQ